MDINKVYLGDCLEIMPAISSELLKDMELLDKVYSDYLLYKLSKQIEPKYYEIILKRLSEYQSTL